MKEPDQEKGATPSGFPPANQSEIETPIAEQKTHLATKVNSSSIVAKTLLSSESGHATPEVGFTKGDRFGQYEILAKLGQGGMGVVYQALHVHLDKVVAIKVIFSRFNQNPVYLTRFNREMKAIGRLDHPNIVRAMDAGEVNGNYYLAMEFIEGKDLHKLLRSQGRFSLIEACDCIRQAANGLDFAHRKDLIHRDLKPSNLLRSETGEIKLLDLGLARIQCEFTLGDADLETFSTMGACLGTPDFMSPEQWENSSLLDHRTDLYALGCTLFNLLAGVPPYHDAKNQNSLVSKMTRHVTAEVPDLRAIRPDVPEDLSRLVRKMMAKSPSDRPESAAEVAAILTVILRSIRNSQESGESAVPFLSPDPIDLQFLNSDPVDPSSPTQLGASVQDVSSPIGSTHPASTTVTDRVRRGFLIAAGLVLSLFLLLIPAFRWSNRPAILPSGQSGQPERTSIAEASPAMALISPSPPAAPIRETSGTNVFQQERDIAQQLVQQGAAISVFFDDRSEAHISMLDQIPERPFRVSQLTVSGKMLSSEVGRSIGKLKSLNYLEIQGNVVDPTALQELAGCQKLRTVGIWSDNLPPDALGFLVQLPLLSKMMVSHAIVQNSGVFSLLEHLRELWIDDCDDDDLERLELATNLRVIAVIREHVSEEAIADLQEHNPNVSVISKAKESARYIGEAPFLNGLRQLKAQKAKLIGSRWPMRQDAAHTFQEAEFQTEIPLILEEVHISGSCHLDQVGLHDLAQTPILGAVVISDHREIRNMLESLLPQSQLQYLTIDGGDFDSRSLELLSAMKQLRTIRISRSNLTETQFQSLRNQLSATNFISDWGEFRALDSGF